MRRGAPTLYEMRAAARDAGPALPGRGSVRLPMGVVAMAVAGCVALTTLAYVTGYSIGRRAGERDAIAAPSPAPVDPIAQDRATGGMPQVGGPGPREGAPSQGTPTQVQSGGLTALTEDDPRQAGLNYFILATTDPVGAAEMVEFCRSNGLDAHIGGGHNGRLRQVVVLPGFPSDGRGSPEIKALEARIKQVGAQWKALRRGNSDFRDYYPKLQKSQP